MFSYVSKKQHQSLVSSIDRLTSAVNALIAKLSVPGDITNAELHQAATALRVSNETLASELPKR
jgi:hypothetical protein